MKKTISALIAALLLVMTSVTLSFADGEGSGNVIRDNLFAFILFGAFVIAVMIVQYIRHKKSGK